jgi:hypothetical protein
MGPREDIRVFDVLRVSDRNDRSRIPVAVAAGSIVTVSCCYLPRQTVPDSWTFAAFAHYAWLADGAAVVALVMDEKRFPEEVQAGGRDYLAGGSVLFGLRAMSAGIL